MDKLNNPTKGTQQHVPTLATMQRSACKLVHSEVRHDLRTCSTGLAGTVAMFVLEVLPGTKMERGIPERLTEAFVKIQASDKTAMNLIILEEDKNATEPGSSSQSYQKVNMQPNQHGLKKWIVLLEFSGPAGLLSRSIETSLQPVKFELENLGGVTCDVYEFICSVRV